MLHGAAVGVGLPMLDCFLNANGTAYANGRPLPVRFGTWSWGCGFTPGRWVPKNIGADYDLPIEIASMAPHKSEVNILSGFDCLLDGASNDVHHSGLMSIRTGVAPLFYKSQHAPTLDVLIADEIGTDTRFRSLEIAAPGNKEDTYSARSMRNKNLPELTPAGLYSRLFGAGFQDPNATSTFTPDPKIMNELSVLSVVKEDRDRLMKLMGSNDRVRMDEYFTSLRQTEKQLSLQLQKPEPLSACSIPAAPPEGLESGYEVETLKQNHRLMSELLGMALACDQTRVFNMVFTNSFSNLHKAGGSSGHHLYTHEEITDAELGYQVESASFVVINMEAWADFLSILRSIPEGDGTLLDNTLVFAHSDTSYAKIHAVLGIPMMTAGKAGGRIKTGMHIASNGDPVTRVGLTMQQVMGMPVASWGTKSMETSRPISEIFA
jgi:hypothetical protein